MNVIDIRPRMTCEQSFLNRCSASLVEAEMNDASAHALQIRPIDLERQGIQSGLESSIRVEIVVLIWIAAHAESLLHATSKYLDAIYASALKTSLSILGMFPNQLGDQNGKK